MSTLYRQSLRSSDPPLPPYLAAVRTLTSALSQSQQPLQTLAETLALLSSLSSSLKSTLSPATAVAVSAGTDTFQRQLVTSLARGSGDSDTSNEGADTRRNVIKAGEEFIQKQLDNRSRISAYGSRFIRPGMTLVVPTSAPSRNIESMLRGAAEAEVPFRVAFVQEAHAEGSDRKPTWADGEKLRAELQASETPTASISTASLAHVLQADSGTASERQMWPTSKTIVLADAVAIMAGGGALASLETQSAASIAHSLGRQVWIVAESGKIVREMDLNRRAPSEIVSWLDTATTQDQKASKAADDALEVTPAKHITGIMTEDGPRSTTFIAEEAIKIWF